VGEQIAQQLAGETTVPEAGRVAGDFLPAVNQKRGRVPLNPRPTGMAGFQERRKRQEEKQQGPRQEPAVPQ